MFLVLPYPRALMAGWSLDQYGGGVLIWVPADWVAAGLTDLPGVRVELVTLGRDMGQACYPGPAEIPASVADVEFYVPSFFPSPAGTAVLGQMPRLRVVQALTAGVDWLRPHVPAKVALCSARGAHDAATAEWVLAAMLGALRALPGFCAAQAAGKWAADAGFFALMKDGALLVNAARGAVVDTGALTAEVASGRLRAALDVTDPEPLPVGHAQWSLPGVFITPHVAASTPVSRQRAAQLVGAQAAAWLRGEPLRNVISGGY
jgi:phosphoglycerate dehydrogenase-like enzyme